MNATLTYDREDSYTPQDLTYQFDDKLNVQFYKRAVKNETSTLEQGRPIFDEIPFIKIIKPGDTTFIIDTPINEIYKQRFAEKYNKWVNTQENTVSGTPLTEWPLLSTSQIAELKAVNVHTVEQLAAMPDSLAQNFMGSHSIRQQAKAFLEVAKDSQYVEKQAAELAKRDLKIDELQRQMAEILKQSKAKPAAE